MAKILLGICGGIAAYKSVLLARQLTQQGHEVKCVLTEHAQHFVSTHTLQAISGETPRSDLFDSQAEAAMGHIELSRWADVLIIAPATANTLAKLALGLADNLLSTLYLASAADILIAPAMNHLMWTHPATQAHIATLQHRAKHHLLPVGIGAQACGETGPGRMAEPEEIIAALKRILNARQDWQGIRLCITAGPTREAIDPVRYLSNHSSGKMGYAIAAAAAARGAQVSLISGPTVLAAPPHCHLIPVMSAVEMHAAALQTAVESDIFIAAAAVADYRVKHIAEHKQKKDVHGTLSIELIENPDIVADVAALQENRPFTVGFAAETEHLLEYARRKREKKGLDLILANNVREQPFGGDHNHIHLISAAEEISLPPASKTALAEQLLDHILKQYQETLHVSH